VADGCWLGARLWFWGQLAVALHTLGWLLSVPDWAELPNASALAIMRGLEARNWLSYIWLVGEQSLLMGCALLSLKMSLSNISGVFGRSSGQQSIINCKCS